MIEVQPPLDFIEPAFNPLVAHALRLLLPAWVRWQVDLRDIQVIDVDRLVTLYQQFQAGKLRFLMAFRHPSTNDPFCMAHLLWRSLPQATRRSGIHLNGLTHAHFIYDRGIPLWAGSSVGWLYSSLGGTPIRRGDVDRTGLRSVRQLFANGQFPLAAAPEGATNGHNELVSPIEPGIAQFGFWCQEDLYKAGRDESVLLVPIGIQYRYLGQPWATLERLLAQLEADSGVSPSVDLTNLQDDQPLTPEQQSVLYQRLYGLGKHLLTQMENFYRSFYQQALPQPSSPSAETENEQLAARLNALLDAALTVAEQAFGLQAKGSFTDRCRRLEQAGWDRIYRDDIKQLDQLSSVERGLANLVAGEATLRLWHMRLVESFVSVTGYYVKEKFTVDRFAETLLLLWEMVARIKGTASFPRPKIGAQTVRMTVAEPLSVTDRWESYKTNRRQAIATLTQDLQMALEQTII